MERELQQNKRLREMFRLLQRTKKSSKKTKELDDDEEQLPATLPKRRTSRKSSKAAALFQRWYGNRKKMGATEETSDDDDDALLTVEPSSSEKRRRDLRKKYGVNLKDEEFFQRACRDDVEEFENVNAVFRPAATKMRQAKLRWKTIENKYDSPTSEFAKGKKDQIVLDSDSRTDTSNTNTGATSDEQTATEHPYQLDNTQSTEEEVTCSVRMEPDQWTKKAETKDKQDKQQEKINRLLKEISIFLVRVADLEQIQKKAAVLISKLKTDLDAKEKIISEQNKRIVFLERTLIEKEVKALEKEEEDKPTPEQEAVALRALGIMKRNQILERILKPTETIILAEFFQEDMSKPNKTIVQMIDKALAYGIEVLLMRPDLFEDVVDNELRVFLLDNAKAKRILLDCMLLHPEYVPISWGGDVLAKRQQQYQALQDSKLTGESCKPKNKRNEWQENVVSRNPNTQPNFVDTKTCSEEFLEKTKSSAFSLVSPNPGLKNEQKREKSPDTVLIKTETLENVKRSQQKENIQEKPKARTPSTVTHGDPQKRKKTLYLHKSRSPVRKKSPASSIWEQDRGERVLRRRKPKAKSSKRKNDRNAYFNSP